MKSSSLSLNLETAVTKVAARPDDGCSELIAEQWIALPVGEVFKFFSDAKNLEVLTPPWLHFHVLGISTPEITQGTLIDYKLRVRGVPIRWQSRIDEWVPNERFVDTMMRGPYAYWHHTHLFAAATGGTQITDIVRYRVPGGALGRMFVLPFVKRDVEKIFNFRRETITKLFDKTK